MALSEILLRKVPLRFPLLREKHRFPSSREEAVKTCVRQGLRPARVELQLNFYAWQQAAQVRKYASTHFSFRRSLPATRFYDNVFTRMIYIVVCCNCIWCARLHTEVDMLQPQKRCMGCMVSICEFYSCFVRRNCMWNPGDHGSSLVV